LGWVGGTEVPIKFEDLFGENEVTYARGRMPDRIYASKSFLAQWGSDAGYPSRYVYKVFDEEVGPDGEDWEWETHVVDTTPAGRKQLQMHVARAAGAVRQIRIQRVPTGTDAEKLETILTLDRGQCTKLIDLIKALESIPADGEASVRVDDQILRDVFSDPYAIGRIYSQNPSRFRALIESDATAEDVIALRRRREVVETMRSWLEDEAAFDAAQHLAKGPERAWQALLEDNPWVLGIGLGGQLYTSWDEEKLEQVTTGANIATAGKRIDALLQTNGLVRSLAFAEIKHHQTPLLAKSPYRPAAWGPSNELAGALVQVQQTVRMAVRDLGEFIAELGDDGSRTGDGTFVSQPRSFLIVGSLGQLKGSLGGAIDDKVHSFELFRRNVVQPEIITFDELLARAEWHVKLAAEWARTETSAADEVDDGWPF
jgi:antiviral defense system Shedu protein SduA